MEWWRTDSARAEPATVMRFHKILAKVCPIVSFSVGDWADKASWVIEFHESATEEQKHAAIKLLFKFEVKQLKQGHQPFRKIY